MTAPHVEAAGALRSPLLLVHAGVADSRMWDPQWESFPRAHRTLRLDLPGFGRTPLPAGPVVPAAAVLAALPAEPTALVGASFGARVALEIALAQPDRVRALVLAAPPPGDDAEPSPAAEAFERAEEAALASGDLDRAVAVNLDTWLAPGADPAVRARLGALAREALGRDADDVALLPDLDERLAELAVPTLVLVGEHDLPDFHSFGARIAAEAPGARLETIPGAGHLPSLERPEAFDALVLDFLAAPRPEAPAGGPRSS